MFTYRLHYLRPIALLLKITKKLRNITTEVNHNLGSRCLRVGHGALLQKGLFIVYFHYSFTVHYSKSIWLDLETNLILLDEIPSEFWDKQQQKDNRSTLSQIRTLLPQIYLRKYWKNIHGSLSQWINSGQ